MVEADSVPAAVVDVVVVLAVVGTVFVDAIVRRCSNVECYVLFKKAMVPARASIYTRRVPT